MLYNFKGFRAVLAVPLIIPLNGACQVNVAFAAAAAHEGRGAAHATPYISRMVQSQSREVIASTPPGSSSSLQTIYAAEHFRHV